MTPWINDVFLYQLVPHLLSSSHFPDNERDHVFTAIVTFCKQPYINKQQKRPYVYCYRHILQTALYQQTAKETIHLLLPSHFANSLISTRRVGHSLISTNSKRDHAFTVTVTFSKQPDINKAGSSPKDFEDLYFLHCLPQPVRQSTS